MGFADALIAEAGDNYTLYLVCGAVVTAALVSTAAVEKSRMRGIVMLVALHLLLLPVVAWLRVAGYAVEAVRLPAQIFAAMAGIAMACSVLFLVLLPRVRVEVPQILRDVVLALSVIVAVFALASAAGFNLSGLIATSAVLTAVIGFSLQDTLGNIMGGLALQMDDSIKVGDWIKIGEVNGQVSQIRWRYTAVETRNWETFIIPNSTMMKGQVQVIARRRGKPPLWRRWVYFNVDFRYPPTDVIDTVNQALIARPIERVSATPEAHCILIDLHESYGRYAVRYWLTDPAVDDPTDSVVRTRIFFALKRAGIPLSIPAHAIFMTEDSSERRAKKDDEERQDRLEALAKVDLFRTLPEEERAALASGLRHAPFSRGELLTRQGAEAHWLYMIIEGDVAIRVAVEDGLEREVARLGPGDFFGEMSLMTGEKRSATVVALTDVECYRLDKGVFQQAMANRPEMAEEIAGLLAERRTQLEAVRDGLDAEARARRVEAAKRDLVGRIRDFFGIDDSRAA